MEQNKIFKIEVRWEIRKIPDGDILLNNNWIGLKMFFFVHFFPITASLPYYNIQKRS